MSQSNHVHLGHLSLSLILISELFITVGYCEIVRCKMLLDFLSFSECAGYTLEDRLSAKINKEMKLVTATESHYGPGELLSKHKPFFCRR